MNNDLHCKLCRIRFIKWKGGGGFNRKLMRAKLYGTNLSVQSALHQFYDYKGDNTGYVCGKCFRMIGETSRDHMASRAAVDEEAAAPSTNRRVNPWLREDHNYTIPDGSNSSPRSEHSHQEVRESSNDNSPTSTSAPNSENSHQEVTESSNDNSTALPKKRKLLNVGGKRGPHKIRRTVTSEHPTWHTSNSASNPQSSINISIAKSRYDTAFRSILARGKVAERAFRKVMKQTIQKEMRSFFKEQAYPRLRDIDDISGFKWVEVIEDMRKVMPTFVESLEAMMPKKPPAEIRETILARLGFMASIALYTSKPGSCQFVQSVIGMQMLQWGGSEKLFRSLNRLGVCQSTTATRKRVDMLCKDNVDNVQSLKDVLADVQEIV